MTERRSAPREEVSATAIVFADGSHRGQYLVRNLSSGGALLVGHASLAIGARAKILLQLSATKVIGVAAEVVRRGHDRPGESAIAVAFHDVSASTKDAIHQAAFSTLRRTRSASVSTALIVDFARGLRKNLERDLRRVDCLAVSATTPLDTVMWIENREARFDAALVSCRNDPSASRDILRYLARDHGHLRRVALYEGEGEVERIMNMGLAHTALAYPWDLEGLERVLQGCAQLRSSAPDRGA